MIKFLIIDDSEIIRSLMIEYLEEKGFKVEYAVDGLEGYHKAIENDYDVIFCDIHMPKKNGFQVMCDVFKVKPDSHFIMTDSMPDELAELALENGACCILTKPFDLDEVDAVIEKITAQIKECNEQ